MENLKITFVLDAPFIADRLTTIDSILIKEFFSLMRERGKHDGFTDDLSMIDFIDKKGDVFSGSVWFIDKKQDVHLDFYKYFKKSDQRKIFDVSKKGELSESAGPFKNFVIPEETILTDSVYFYVRGKRNAITQLLKRVKFFGKKSSIGFGHVADILIGEMDEDRSFQLNESSASKPLPCDLFELKSKKIAPHRRTPPYWSNRGISACYMPTSSLYESIDQSDKSKYKVAKDLTCVPAVSFVAKNHAGKLGMPVCDTSAFVSDGKSKNPRWRLIEDNKDLVCCATGEIVSTGITNPYGYFAVKAAGFMNHNRLMDNDFLSIEVLWSLKIDVARLIGDTLTTAKEIKGITISAAAEGERFADYLRKPTMLKPPFLFLRKSSNNTQHVLFQSRVALSNAYFPLQFGNETLYVDALLLEEGVKEGAKLIKDNPELTKSHLTGMWAEALYPSIKNSVEEGRKRELKQVIQSFHKKYDKTLRMLIFSVKF